MCGRCKPTGGDGVQSVAVSGNIGIFGSGWRLRVLFIRTCYFLKYELKGFKGIAPSIMCNFVVDNWNTLK